MSFGLKWGEWKWNSCCRLSGKNTSFFPKGKCLAENKCYLCPIKTVCMKKLMLIDAYAMIYRAYYAFIKNPRINSKGMNTSAVFGFINILEDAIRREQPTHVGVAFDPKGKTFRHEAYEAYKQQREITPEDIRKSVPVIRQLLDAYRIPALEVPGFEADDVIGTLSKEAEKEGFTVLMLTPDKDYGQLVSENIFMYRPRHSGGFEQMGPQAVCDKYSIRNVSQIIDLLGLMGDKSDNIPGCPGVGEKTAVKLLAEFGSIDNLLENTEKLTGALRTKIEMNKENIRFSRYLVTIRTDVPIQFEPDKLLLEEPDKKALADLYRDLEFRTLLARLQQDGTGAVTESPVKETGKTSVGNSQLSLFEDVKKENPTTMETYVFSQMAPEDRNFLMLKDIPHNYRLVADEEGIRQLAEELLQQSSVCFDTETTSQEAMRAEIVGISFCWHDYEACYVPLPEQPREVVRILEHFRPFFENTEIEKIGQNMKYDLLVLRQYGFEVRGPMFDTMIAHYLLQPELRHGMDYMASIYLKYRPISYQDLVGKGKETQSLRKVDVQRVCEYSCEDADVTFRLKSILNMFIESQGLVSLFHDVEMPLMQVLAEMEYAGVRIDLKALKHSSEMLTRELAQVEAEVQLLAGTAFNISSPRQVGDVLFDVLHLDDKAKRTKSGQYSTSEEVLEQLRHKHPVVEKILEYRMIKKLLNTYIDALPLLINPKTGKLHTSFNQTITATGRLSSSNPNLQNIPVRTELGREIRKAFVPDSGHVFMSADYSQIELRIMAHLSEDEHMIEAFRNGNDIHAATAARIHKIPLTDVTSDMRREAKTANFGIIYGISAFGLAERLNISRTDAKKLIDNYFETYPHIRDFIQNSIQKAQQTGYAETLLHRKRYLPDINSQNRTVRGYAERNAVNAPIQGTAADIIKIAMINISRRLHAGNYKAQMTMQVHDELTFTVPNEELEAVRRIVVEEMEGAMQLLVPLEVECGTGANWFEAH